MTQLLTDTFPRLAGHPLHVVLVPLLIGLLAGYLFTRWIEFLLCLVVAVLYVVPLLD